MKSKPACKVQKHLLLDDLAAEQKSVSRSILWYYTGGAVILGIESFNCGPCVSAKALKRERHASRLTSRGRESVPKHMASKAKPLFDNHFARPSLCSDISSSATKTLVSPWIRDLPTACNSTSVLDLFWPTTGPERRACRQTVQTFSHEKPSFICRWAKALNRMSSCRSAQYEECTSVMSILALLAQTCTLHAFELLCHNCQLHLV